MGCRCWPVSPAVIKAKTPPVPELGTIGWLVFDPQAGREQARHRSQSHALQREDRPRCLLSITSKVKDYPFELAVPVGLPVAGVVLCDYVRSQECSKRKWQPICKVPLRFVHDIMARTMTLFEVSGF
jgi:mRNA interferase MazF